MTDTYEKLKAAQSLIVGLKSIGSDVQEYMRFFNSVFEDSYHEYNGTSVPFNLKTHCPYGEKAILGAADGTIAFDGSDSLAYTYDYYHMNDYIEDTIYVPFDWWKDPDSVKDRLNAILEEQLNKIQKYLDDQEEKARAARKAQYEKLAKEFANDDA